jgi:diguanylate cyclase
LAEGVETQAELQFLQRELCDEAQGYFLGRPAEIESFRHVTHAGEAEIERSTVTPFVPKPLRT